VIAAALSPPGNVWRNGSGYASLKRSGSLSTNWLTGRERFCSEPPATVKFISGEPPEETVLQNGTSLHFCG
jgi:hypothetical protein